MEKVTIFENCTFNANTTTILIIAFFTVIIIFGIIFSIHKFK